jgi:hypothetical protein
VPFSLIILKAKLIARLFWLVSLRVPSRSIREYSACTVHCNLSPAPQPHKFLLPIHRAEASTYFAYGHHPELSFMFHFYTYL